MEEDDDESSKSEVKLGKLQFSLDYDFQKGEVSRKKQPPKTLETKILSASIVVPIAAVCGGDSGRGSARHGHVRHVGPIREGVPDARQEEEARDEGSPQDPQPCLQRDLRLQGTRAHVTRDVITLCRRVSVGVTTKCVI